MATVFRLVTPRAFFFIRPIKQEQGVVGWRQGQQLSFVKTLHDEERDRERERERPRGRERERERE